MNERLEIALAQARMGREVFPFVLGAPDGGGRRPKTPKVRWTVEATTDEAVIREWWRKWPIALPGWRLPAGVVVVDVDDPARFEAAGLDIDLKTSSQLTPRGGYHLAFEYDPALGEPPQTVKGIEGADTRTGGKGWVGLYAADSFASAMSAAPGWLYEVRARREQAEDPIGEEMGTRDEILRWLGQLRRQRFTGPEMLALLQAAREEGRIVALDESRPWTDADLKALAKEASKWEMGPPPVDEDAILAGIEAWKRRRGPVLGTRRIERDEPGDPDEVLPMFVPLASVDPSDPRPLELGFLDPDEHTILFGDGGTGKGMVAAWWAAQLSAGGALVAVLDYEAHARFEWRPRVERFGGDLSRVWIAQPSTEPIWRVAGKVRAELEALARDHGVERAWLIVDSVSYACIGAPVEDSSTAIKYSAAVAEIGLPTVSLAHTTKADDDPKHPFGSVFWSNGARITIGMTGSRKDAWRRLENKKTNQRGYFPTIELDWSWALDPDALPPQGGLEWEPVEDRSSMDSDGERQTGLTSAILRALDGLDHPVTVYELMEDEGVLAATESRGSALRSTLSRALNGSSQERSPLYGQVVKGEQRNGKATWSRSPVAHARWPKGRAQGAPL